MDRFCNFKEYLLGRGVVLSPKSVEEIKRENSQFSMEEILMYMSSLKSFHDKARGFNNYMIEKLPNKTGELFCSYNIMYRRFQREIKRMEMSDDINECDRFILSFSDEMENRARMALEYNSFGNYEKVLQRSMDRIEVCLGDFEMDSLKGDSPLIVQDISKCFYDMIENDIIRLITRMKRKNIVFSWEDIISEFIELENLDVESDNYIRSCLSYPYEFMRTSWRYFQGRRKWSLKRYIEKLERAMKQDGKSII